jgi:hypothetical protein
MQRLIGFGRNNLVPSYHSRRYTLSMGWKRMFCILALVLTFGSPAWALEEKPVLTVTPTLEELGPGWTTNLIAYLLDPKSDPPAIDYRTDPKTSFMLAYQRDVMSTNNRTGCAMVLYGHGDMVMNRGLHRVFVQRWGNRRALHNAWVGWKMDINRVVWDYGSVGEDFFWTSEWWRQTQVKQNLVFRRGLFHIVIEAGAASDPADMVRLAQAFDAKIRGRPVPKAAPAGLPDPLTSASGKKISSAAEWTGGRRAEVLELFRQHVYGRTPVGRPSKLSFSVDDTSAEAMDGTATRKLVTIGYEGPGGSGAIRLVLFLPNQRPGPAPCFLLICNREPANIDPTRRVKSPFWPAEQMIGRGYAAAAFYNADVDPDVHDGFTNGVHGIFDPPGPRRTDAWGTIAAWAWGASRVMDYLQTDSGIDPGRVAVVGHSRGGKTALWAGAEDERFAMVVSNDSGSTGAALARGKKGERIADINRAFPHWFCERYRQYNGREDALPVDQHMLLALVAPRLLYVASATEDTWADPASEFLATLYASPVYHLFGFRGVAGTVLPPPETPLHDGRIGYHLRTGKHNLTEYDWARFMDFADRHLAPGRRP